MHNSTGNELLETISNSASSCPYSIILMDIDLGEQLKPDFCRCHNSFCVNLHAVCTYSHQGIQLSGGYTVPVSRSYYQSVKDSLAFIKLVHHKEVES